LPAVKRPQSRPDKPSKGDRGGARKPQAKSGRSWVPVRTLVAATAVLLIGGGLIAAASGGRGQAVAATIGHGVDTSFSELGFRMARVDVRGASAFAEPLIRDAVGVSDGSPSLGVDIAALRERIEKVGYVRSATVARMLPDVLVVSVVERNRQAVWQHAGQIHVIDDHGKVIPEANPGLFSGLPMVVGEGADEAAHDILPLVQARPRLMTRLEALVRVDGRRWDLRLKDGSLIQLPSLGEDAALIQLDQLDQRSRLLELGFERIDLRDAETVSVRPRGQPAPIPAAYLPKPVEAVSTTAAVAPIKTAATVVEAKPAAKAPAITDQSKPSVKAAVASASVKIKTNTTTTVTSASKTAAAPKPVKTASAAIKIEPASKASVAQ